MKMRLDGLKEEINEIAKASSTVDDLMLKICQRLGERMSTYSWVGFYMIDIENPQFLQLGPYVGADTPHKRIRLDQGICGAAASSGEPLIVNDVSKDPRYLACSVETKSEIVVPVFVDRKVVGELDIDSYFAEAFRQEDRELIEHCAGIVGDRIQADQIQGEIDEMAKTCSTANDLMRKICQRLNERVPKYNWVGFYMIDDNDPEFLQLRNHVGKNTPHTRIRLGEGICGTAALEGTTLIVNDVSQDPRYLACSVETRSEIVVPVFVSGKVSGELDIDSNLLAAFKDADRRLIEHCAKVVGTFVEK